jgi:anti-anti-sigma regulatory factor
MKLKLRWELRKMILHPLIYFDMRQDIVVTTTDSLTKVRITGNLTVRNAMEIAEIFQTIEGENIAIELQEPSAIDLSFLQILLSRTHDLKQKGSQVNLSTALRDTDAKLLTTTGFSRLL